MFMFISAKATTDLSDIHMVLLRVISSFMWSLNRVMLVDRGWKIQLKRWMTKDIIGLNGTLHAQSTSPGE